MLFVYGRQVLFVAVLVISCQFVEVAVGKIVSHDVRVGGRVVGKTVRLPFYVDAGGGSICTWRAPMNMDMDERMIGLDCVRVNSSVGREDGRVCNVYSR